VHGNPQEFFVLHLRLGRFKRIFGPQTPPSAKLLHHDPAALNFIQIKLDRCGRLGRRHIGGLDLAEDFPLGAQQERRASGASSGRRAS
jgi:hypothetical protein